MFRDRRDISQPRLSVFRAHVRLCRRLQVRQLLSTGVIRCTGNDVAQSFVRVIALAFGIGCFDYRYPESARAQAKRQQLSGGSAPPSTPLPVNPPSAEGSNLTLFNVSAADALRTPQFWLLYAGLVHNSGALVLLCHHQHKKPCAYNRFGLSATGSYAIISNGKAIMTECFG